MQQPRRRGRKRRRWWWRRRGRERERRRRQQLTPRPPPSSHPSTHTISRTTTTTQPRGAPRLAPPRPLSPFPTAVLPHKGTGKCGKKISLAHLAPQPRRPAPRARPPASSSSPSHTTSLSLCPLVWQRVPGCPSSAAPCCRCCVAVASHMRAIDWENDWAHTNLHTNPLTCALNRAKWPTVVLAEPTDFSDRSASIFYWISRRAVDVQ